jgi:hypothetical protein
VPAPRLDSVAAYVAAYHAAGYDFLKPHDERREMFDSVVTAARRLRLPVAGHVTNFVPLEQGLTAGMHSIEHLTGYGIRSDDWERAAGKPTSYIPTLAAVTKRAGVWNCPTLILYEPKMPLPGVSSAPVEPYRRLVKALQDAGAGLLLGTDAGVGAAIEDQVGTVHAELQALVRAGLTPYQALLTGTRNVASYFGTLDETGTLAVGKRADLVLLRGNPLADIANTLHPAGVMLGGRWLPRAELDRRLADRPGERKRYYEEYATSAFYGDFLFPLTQQLLADTSGKLLLTEAQLNALQPLRGTQRAQLAALVDSLGTRDSLAPSAAVVIGHHRVLRLLAQQIGELYAGLPPMQQAVVGPLAQAWVQQYARQGYAVVIPGLTP